MRTSHALACTTLLCLAAMGVRGAAAQGNGAASPQAALPDACARPAGTAGQPGGGPQPLTDAAKASRLAAWQAAAAENDACAQFQLGHAYATGQLGPTDRAQALPLLKEAADRGVVRAYADLGVLLLDGGDGVAQDLATALQYLLKATDAGEMKAPRYVGMLYEDGRGVAVDAATAARYYAIAADRGDITGQCLLGSLYERGVGVARDLDLAEHWYLQSQQRGDEVAAPAMAALGNLFETRTDGRRSESVALGWYRKAVGAGIALAQDDIERLEHAKGPPPAGRNECLLHFHSRPPS